MINYLVQTFTEDIEPDQTTRFYHLIVMMFGTLYPTRSNSCREIGATIPGSPDGSNLNDSLRNHPEFYEVIFLSVLYSSIIWMVQKSKPGTPIYLSLDDTFIPKSRKQKSLAFAYYCGHKKGHGFYVVAGHLQIGKYHLPLGFRIYYPKSGVSKQTLAIKILQEVAPMLTGFHKITVLTDSGYADQALMKYVNDELGWSWLSGIKCNRCLSGKAVEACFRYISNGEYIPLLLYKRHFLVTSLIGFLNGFKESGLFIASKTKKSYKPVSWRYYYSSDTSLTVREALERYSNRWRIENDFWTLKEQLNMNEFVFHKEDVVKAYLHVVYTTYMWVCHTKNEQVCRKRSSTIPYGTGEIITELRNQLKEHFFQHGEQSIQVILEEFMKKRLQRTQRE